LVSHTRLACELIESSDKLFTDLEHGVHAFADTVQHPISLSKSPQPLCTYLASRVEMAPTFDFTRFGEEHVSKFQSIEGKVHIQSAVRDYISWIKTNPEIQPGKEAENAEDAESLVECMLYLPRDRQLLMLAVPDLRQPLGYRTGNLRIDTFIATIEKEPGFARPNPVSEVFDIAG
jgi:hypothetical protein